MRACGPDRPSWNACVMWAIKKSQNHWILEGYKSKQREQRDKSPEEKVSCLTLLNVLREPL